MRIELDSINVEGGIHTIDLVGNIFCDGFRFFDDAFPIRDQSGNIIGENILFYIDNGMFSLNDKKYWTMKVLK